MTKDYSVRKYKETIGACPVCQSKKFNCRFGMFWCIREHRVCLDCNAEWYEVYALSQIEEVPYDKRLNKP